MKKLWKKLLAITAVSLTISLAGLVMAGQVFGAAPPQCVDNGNGTVTDNSAALMWQKATAGPMNWNEARSHAFNIPLGAHFGWRLPSINELEGLYNSQCKNMMDVKTDWYWSDVTLHNNKNYAWRVDFSDGGVSFNYKSDISHSGHYVRAVRTAK